MAELNLRCNPNALDPSEEPRWFKYGSDGLELSIRPMLEEEFNSLQKKARVEVYLKHQRQLELDPDELDEVVTKTALVDWRGMTGTIFCRYAHVKPESLARECGAAIEDLDKSFIPFEMKVALYVSRRCAGFADAIYNMARTIVEEKEDATKN